MCVNCASTDLRGAWVGNHPGLPGTQRIQDLLVVWVFHPRSHALRGNALCDAPRPRHPLVRPQSGPARHSHAERGNENHKLQRRRKTRDDRGRISCLFRISDFGFRAFPRLVRARSQATHRDGPAENAPLDEQARPGVAEKSDYNAREPGIRFGSNTIPCPNFGFIPDDIQDRVTTFWARYIAWKTIGRFRT